MYTTICCGLECFCTKCVRGLTAINSTFFVSSEINSPYFFITLNFLVPSLLSILSPPLSPTGRKPYAGFLFSFVGYFFISYNLTMLLARKCSCFKRLRQNVSAANSTSTVPMRNTEARMVSMIKKLRVPIRVQFLVIAPSLAVTTTVLGLSAYLTDTDTYQGTFKTVGG